MRFFIAFVFCVLLGSIALFWHPAAEQKISDDPDLSLPAFSRCRADTDCKLVALPCGAIGASNATQHKFVRRWYQKKIDSQTCPATAPSAHKAVCANNLCIAKPDTNTTTGYSVVDTPEPAHVP